MATTTVVRQINAPVEYVFAVVADISKYSEAIPHMVNVEFLSEIKTGVGARFRETRIMRGRQASTELEITEHVANERVRFVSDAGGTIWDTVFTFTTENGATAMTMVMQAKAYKLLAKLLNPLLKGMVEKAVIADMDALKDYCEKNHNQTAST